MKDREKEFWNYMRFLYPVRDETGGKMSDHDHTWAGIVELRKQLDKEYPRQAPETQEFTLVIGKEREITLRKTESGSFVLAVEDPFDVAVVEMSAEALKLFCVKSLCFLGADR